MTRTEIIELAKQCGAIDSYPGSNDGIVEFEPDQLEAFFHAAQALEREACAKVCESLFDMDDDSCNEAELCATAIRNRGIQRGIDKILADPEKYGLDLGEKQ